MMKKSKIVVLALLVVVLMAGVGLVVLMGNKQAAIGDFSSKLSCETYAKKNFCPSYDCTPCTYYNAGYTMSFSDGTVTSNPYTSDCKAKGTGGSSYTLCGVTALPTTPPTTTPTPTPTPSTSCGSSPSCTQNGATRAVSGKPQYYEVCKYFNSGCGLQWIGNNYCGTGQYYIAGSCQKGYDCGVVEAGWTCDYLTGVAYTGQSGSGSCLGSTCAGANVTKGTGYSYINGACTTVFDNKQQYTTLSACTTAHPAPTTTTPPATGGSTCAVSFTCIDSVQIEYTSKTCAKQVLKCMSGRECQAGNCVSTAPVTPPTQTTPPTGIDSCTGVTCSDYCDAAYTAFTQGTCTNAQCNYASVKLNSPDCLPAPTNTTGGGITGNVVVDVPVRDATTPTWFDKYGLWVLGGLAVVLVVVYIAIPEKKKKKR